ncbi:hypothetical protein [Frigoriglobus tundricola]|uniref:Cytochrome c family protein n=1 Tax=Frigoriglobus tundricola TaxID=2774151 RepID=A0A6M5YTK1_9BACT|nr:hypothetical protein [Frigoriglobus tundricola]QJW97348.1 hypothetical protein FTUN_4919 [Frigoriglobus tundricola]
MPPPRCSGWPMYLTGPVLGFLAAVAFALCPPHRGEAPRADAPARALDPSLPAEPNETEDQDKDQLAFSQFSWGEFVALNWPARDRTRGEADPDKPFGAATGPVVWESWKSVDELFPPNPEDAPTEWKRLDAVIGIRSANKDGKLALSRLDRPADKSAFRKVLPQVAHLQAVNQAGFFAAQLGPLVAQNGTYVRYETRVNQVAYNFVVDGKYYLRNNLPSSKNMPPVPFLTDSIIVKAAWMELTERDDQTRFYCVRADLVDGVQDSKPIVRTATVGLVGLHIARRTLARPSWIWTTFEHVDNTEPGPGAGRASFSRNDPATVYTNGTDSRPPAPIPEGTPLPACPKAVGVERMNCIPQSARQANAQFYQKVKGTVWQHYRLVATQWIPKKDPGDPGSNLFQPTPNSGVANTAIETYIQTSSCLVCHAFTPDFRFVFFPSVRAHSPKKGP